MMFRTLSFLILFSFFGLFLVWAMGRAPLEEALHGKETLHVYVLDVTESRGKTHPDISSLERELKKQLTQEKNPTFVLARKLDEANLVIQCDVVEYFSREEDRRDPKGPGSMALDAMVQKDMARLQADFWVKDAKTKKRLWHKRLAVVVSQDDLSLKEKVRKLNQQLVERFLKESFG